MGEFRELLKKQYPSTKSPWEIYVGRPFYYPQILWDALISEFWEMFVCAKADKNRIENFLLEKAPFYLCKILERARQGVIQAAYKARYKKQINLSVAAEKYDVTEAEFMANIPELLAGHQSAYKQLVDFWTSLDFKVKRQKEKVKSTSFSFSYVDESHISAQGFDKLEQMLKEAAAEDTGERDGEDFWQKDGEDFWQGISGVSK